MGANNGSKVAAYSPKAGGGVFWAPRGTVLPTDASTALDEKFKCLGAISDEGVKPSIEAKTDQVKEWDGSTLANLLTDESRSFEFTLLSPLDKDVLEFAFGATNVTVTAPTSTAGTKTAVLDKGGKPDQGVLVLDMKFGSKKIRKIVPVADPVIKGEEAYVLGKLSGYSVEVEAIKDATGVRVYEYSEDSDKLAA